MGLAQQCGPMVEESKPRVDRLTSDGTADDPRLRWVVSVDDHLVEPPHVFVDRVPRAQREEAPHVEVIDGVDTWCYDGGRQRVTIDGFVVAAGKEWGTFTTGPVSYAEMRPA